ncbi:MAG: methionyl-tRNA formyltransferase [Bacteroidia bacterium]|nr:methionyl-tRNA formyltransferase [Bacteroidia bacterium]
MGTPEFAVPSLEILVQHGYDVVGVVTAPDKPAGRGLELMKSAVKEFAEKNNLKILQPTNLKSEEFISELRSLNADLQIVVAFRMLPEAVWNMPALGTYNVHASLLPAYRGAAPINWAIINGEKESGVTTFKLQHQIDTGSILFQEKISIGENMNVGELYEQLMKMGAELLLKSVKAIENGNYQLTEQKIDAEEEKIKHAPKIFKETCRIDWNKSADQIYDLIRGLSPYPAAWTELVDESGNKTQVKIFIAKKENSELQTKETGTIETENNNSIKVASLLGFIFVEELQLAGKKRMKTSEFLRGFKISPSHKFL